MSLKKNTARRSVAGHEQLLKKSHAKKKSASIASKLSSAHVNTPRRKVVATKLSTVRRTVTDTPHAVRETSKLARVIALLRRKGGASLAEVSKATGWQAHSVRGAISGAIKKKLGFAVSSEKCGGVRTYRIVG